jgi:hypothetical protein
MFHYNDQEAKTLILKYKNEEIPLTEVENYLTLFIYHFPLIQYRVKETDTLGEFYAYFTDRLEKVLVNYELRDNVQFKTYFYLTLKRHYINYVKSTKRQVVLEIQDMDDVVDYERFSNNQDEAIDQHCFNMLEQFNLSKEDMLFIKLFYPEVLSHEDCVILSNKMGVSVSQVIERLDLLLEDVYLKGQKGNQFLNKTSIKIVAQFLNWSPQKVTKKLSSLRKKYNKKM